MPTTRSFGFDAVAGAPSYGAVAVRDVFEGLITNGVVPGLDSALAVIAGTGMSVEVQPGAAFVQGAVFRLVQGGGNEVLSVPANATGSTRLDRVVVRLDLTTSPNGVSLVYRTGTTSAPALTQTSTVWEISLARVSVADGATSITTANITDERTFTQIRAAAGITDLDHPYDMAYIATSLERHITATNTTVTPAAGKQWEVLGYTPAAAESLGNAASPTFYYHANPVSGSVQQVFARLFPIDAGQTIYLASGAVLRVRERAADTTKTSILVSSDNSGTADITVPSGKRYVIQRACYQAGSGSAAMYLYDTGYGTAHRKIWPQPRAGGAVGGAATLYLMLGNTNATNMQDPQMPEPVVLYGGRTYRWNQTQKLYLMGYEEAASTWTVQNS